MSDSTGDVTAVPTCWVGRNGAHMPPTTAALPPPALVRVTHLREEEARQGALGGSGGEGAGIVLPRDASSPFVILQRT